MDDKLAIQIFEGKKVRVVWDEEQEKYFFSVVDVVGVLTDSIDYQAARKYWKVLKGRLIKEGNESVTNCYQLKLPSSDGKNYKTDVADLQGIFRIIQSIPSKKAEPVKQWLAQLGQHGRSVISKERASDYIIEASKKDKADELPLVLTIVKQLQRKARWILCIS